MPMKALVIKFGAYGLCIPGCGLDRFHAMGRTLFAVLETVLPTQFNTVDNAIKSVGRGSGNGYDLLWKLAMICCPSLDITNTISTPIWPDKGDIFLYSRMVRCYQELSRHRGSQMSEQAITLVFVRGLRGKYVDQSRNLDIQISSLVPTTFDGYGPSPVALPEHFHIEALAERLHNSHGQVLPGGLLPPPPNQRINTLQGMDTNGQDVDGPQGYVMDGFDMDTCGLIQGSEWELKAKRFAKQGNSQRRRPPPRGSNRFSEPDVSKTNSRNGQSQTNTRFGPRPRHNGLCEACGMKNHTADRCDRLAMALLIEKYIRNGENKETCLTAEKQWLERNQRFLQQRGERGNRSKETPRETKVRYLEALDLDLTHDDLCEQVDWDHFLATDDE